jgi:hypothetical protein
MKNSSKLNFFSAICILVLAICIFSYGITNLFHLGYSYIFLIGIYFFLPICLINYAIKLFKEK